MKRTPLKPGKQPQRRKGLNQLSKRTRARIPERQRVRARVFERDGGCVLRQLVPGHECVGPLTPHHIKKASQGGTYTEDNLVTACAWGNGVWIETHRAEAEALGLHKPGWSHSA